MKYIMLVGALLGSVGSASCATLVLGKSVPGDRQFDVSADPGNDLYETSKQLLDAGNHTEGMRLLHEAAERGHRGAKLQQAIHLLKSPYPLLHVEAVGILRTMAEESFDPAGLSLAHYFFNNGANAEAFAFLEPLIKKGNPQAHNFMGFAYLEGKVEGGKDVAQAISFFEQAVEKGDSAGRTNLAKVYAEEEGYIDLPRAEALYKENVAAGDGAAMFNLALLYHEGTIPDHEAEAPSLFQQAFSAGVRAAQPYLSLLVMDDVD